MGGNTSVLKLLSKKQISRELFKVCRFHHFETLAQVEEYFEEHLSFDGLQWCGPEEKKELEILVGVDLKRLVARWQIPAPLLQAPSVISIADFLLKNQLLPEKQLEVFRLSFRLYKNSRPRTPAEVARKMDLTERSVRLLRKRSLTEMWKKQQVLNLIPDDFRQNYGLDLNSPLLMVDKKMARHINSRADTNFSPQFLGFLFGVSLDSRYFLLGTPEEVLSGNYLGIRHYWKHFYLLKKELAAAIDLDALVKESFRLLHHSDLRKLNFKTFVSHFLREVDFVEMDVLLRVVGEILFREFELSVDAHGRLLFPPQEAFPLCRYSREALEILGEPSRLEVIRHKVEEMVPGVVVDSERYDLVLLDKWGFTGYKGLYGLKKWYRGGKLKDQDPAFLEELTGNRPPRTGNYWKEHWDRKLAKVKAFTQTHGRLPKKEGPAQEKELWEWLRRQMAGSRQGTLDPRQQKLYEAFREQFPVRSPKFWENYWKERFQELKKFAQSHSRPPARSGSQEETVLYSWYKQQRILLKKGQLSIDQKALLREFSVRYPLRPVLGFETRFRQLKEFTETHHRLPGQDSAAEEKRLNSFWLYLLDRMNQGKLSAEQVSRIKKLKRKFRYNSEHHKQQWEERFEELKAFAAVHGVPKGHKCTGQAKTLRGWLIAQRIRSKKGELDSRQHRLLREFDEQYQLTGNKKRLVEWDRKFRALEDFAETHSRSPKLRDEADEVLYRWFVTQRTNLKNGNLESRQQQLLTDFMIRYPVKGAAYREASWHDKFGELENFTETQGRLPWSTPEEEKGLYTWLRAQQRKAKERQLEKNRRKRLRALETRFDVKNKIEEQWEVRVAELKEFVVKHFRLPKRSADDRERSLYYWCYAQIKRMNEGKLNERQKLLLKVCITNPGHRENKRSLQ